MITLVYGQPGSGKTLYALWAMSHAIRAGLPVSTNIALTSKCPFEKQVTFIDDEEYFICRETRPGAAHGERDAFWRYLEPGGLVVIDEADNYFDSQDFQKLGQAEDARLYFKQHRKRADNVILIVQAIENLWVRIRRNVQRFVRAEATHRARPWASMLPNYFWSFVYAEAAMEPKNVSDFLTQDFIPYRRARKMFSWFRTDQLLGGVERYRWGTGGGENEKAG